MTLIALLNTPSFPEAKCMDGDPDFFFPVSQVELEQRLERLRAICASCIHQAPCRTFSINNQEEHGFWGGLTSEERSHLINREIGMNTKEAGTRRFREIQEHLSQGLDKHQIAAIFKVKVQSIDRTLERAKKKGLAQ
jgi:hypothetical protein